MTKRYKIDLERAQRLADVADSITKKFYLSSQLQVKAKADDTPVTQADTGVEKALSKIVIEEFKESYLGEEGVNEGNSDRLWIVDPIDGTKNYMRGMPIWGSLIALSENGQVVASVCSAPALGRRWWASKGGGAWTKDVDGTVRQLHVSSVDKINDSFLLTPSLLTRDESQKDLSQKVLLDLLDSVWRHRGLGEFFCYMLVAEGAADMAIDFPRSWDIAAPMLIVEEAGGNVWMKNEILKKPKDEQIAVATNMKLEKPALAALKIA